MSRQTRDGTTAPVSRDQILRRERGQEGKTFFPVELTSRRNGKKPRGGIWQNLTRLIHTLLDYMCVFIKLHCVCVCFLPIHSGHQVRWTYQPGSHRRKVTQDFSSTFFLRCVPSFFSREGFSHSFPSSTVKSNFVYYFITIFVLHPLGIFILFFSFFSEKNPACRDRTHVPTCQRVTRYL